MAAILSKVFLNQYTLAGTALIIVIMIIYAVGYEAGLNNTLDDWNNEKLETQAALIQLTAANAVLENEAREKTKAAQDDLQKAVDAVRGGARIVINDLHSDNLKLREQFTGCRNAVRGDTPNTTGDNSPSNPGLSKAYAALAIQLAADADEITERYLACQKHALAVEAVRNGL